MPARPTTSSLSLPVRILLYIIFAGYVAYVASMFYGGYVAAENGQRPWYTDFTHTYAASLLIQQLPAEYLYDDQTFMKAMYLAAEAAFGPGLSWGQSSAINFAPWMYPPTFILVIAPLAYLPYLLAYLGWIAVTAVPYLAAMRSILNTSSAWPFALALPTTYSNLMYGQTGLLSAGMIGLGLVLLRQRPWLAGVLIGLASVKPHLGLLIPLALMAGGYWRTFASATATVLFMIAASMLVYGMEPWYATLGSIDFYLEGFKVGGYNLYTMTSVLSAVRIAGGSIEAMWAAQNVSLALMAALVAWIWWQGRNLPHALGLQYAILCFATPLAIPMVYVYDLAILAPGAAWLWCDLRAHSARKWEITLLVLALAWPMFSYEFASYTGIQLGALSPAILLALALRRWLQQNAPSSANLPEEKSLPA